MLILLVGSGWHIYRPFYDIFRSSLEELTSKRAPSLTPYIPIIVRLMTRSFACASSYPVELHTYAGTCDEISQISCGFIESALPHRISMFL